MKIKTLLLCIGISTQISAQNNNNQMKDSVDYNTCTCREIENINTNHPFYQTLNSITNYTMLTKFISWKLVGGEKTFNKLFYKNYNSSRNTDGSSVFETFTLTSFNHVLLFKQMQDSIGINLTPCKSKFYNFDINAYFRYPISRYIRNYDFEKEFDNYAQSYVNILCEVYDDEENLLKGIFDNKDEEETISIIAQINTKYKTDVVYDRDGKYLDYIPVLLREKDVPFNQFIADMFVKTDDQTRPVNEIEKERINNIFGVYTSYNTINTVKELITPTISISSEAEYISFIIDSKMLHRPNKKKDKTATEILTHISHFNFNTEKSLNFDIKEICLPLSEIARTGVFVSYTGKNVKFINSSRLLITDGASISIPVKKINAEVKNMSLNNKIISGDIILLDSGKLNEINRYLKQKGFKITLTNGKNHFEKTIK